MSGTREGRKDTDGDLVPKEPGAHDSNLRALLDAGRPFPVEQALRIGLGLVDGLSPARDKGVSCHYVLPEDVVVQKDGCRVRLSRTRRVDGRSSQDQALRSPYASPEACRGEDADERTTVWAVGAVLLEMLVGRPPSRKEGLPDVLEVRPEVPEALATLVYRMLDPDPEMRLQTLEAVRAKLTSILEAVGGGTGPLEFAEQREASPRESRDSGAVVGDGSVSAAFIATSFVGRGRELGEIAERLEDPQCRLLTLVGPGGIGKSRLAFEAARRMAGSFDDGVCFVPLGATRSAVFIVFAIGGALELSFSGPRDPKLQLLGYLRDKNVLLVLDDFDRLLEGTGLVTELLENTRGVKVIVTSRERLGSRTEWLFEVEGLEVPGEEDDTDPWEYDSVRLFCERAKRVDAGFTLEEDTRSQAARICRLVEGVPLGIELAAGWARVLSCGEIAGEIERGVDVLSTRERDVPEKHRSIGAALDWSWGLLRREEQFALARLSVFSGGFTREAAEEVAGASLTMLLTLVDKSLVRRDAFGRWQIHELTRQFLDERLGQSPERLEAAMDRHCSWYAKFVEVRPMLGWNARQEADQIEEEFGNLQKAWDWALENCRLDDVDRFVDRFYSFCRIRGWHTAGEDTFGLAVRHLSAGIEEGRCSPEEGERVLGGLLVRQAAFRVDLGDYHGCRRLLRDARGLIDETGQPKELALALRVQANAAIRQGEYEEARQLLADVHRIGI